MELGHNDLDAIYAPFIIACGFGRHSVRVGSVSRLRFEWEYRGSIES